MLLCAAVCRLGVDFQCPDVLCCCVQLRQVGRKYKLQAESVQKELDERKASQEQEQASSAQVGHIELIFLDLAKYSSFLMPFN